MNEKGIPTEERLREVEKQRAEAERALSVVKAKEAHALIEQTERRRKLPIVSSLSMRITVFSETIKPFMSFNAPSGLRNDPVFLDSVHPIFQSFYSTYESIRNDFMEGLELSEKRMNELFPRIEFEKGSYDALTTTMLEIIQQHGQMFAYLYRFMF